jgi:epsin
MYTYVRRLVQDATNNDACLPDARTLACIAEAAFDMDDYWRIAKVLHQRIAKDWKEWRPVYKALVILEFLLTHGPEDLSREFLPDMPAMKDLRSFNYIDDKGFNWGVCMQRRTDSILTLLTDGNRLKEARRRVQHDGSPTWSSSPSSAASQTSRTCSFGSHYSDSPTATYTSDADYRHDKKFDAYTADDKWWPPAIDDDDAACWDTHLEDDPSSGSWSARFYSMLGGGRTSSSGFRSLSQPERRTNKKLQRQLSSDY